MRNQVVHEEIAQFRKYLLAEVSQDQMPKLTLIVVNKRITQRFFVQNESSKRLSNPPTGCIIDSGLISHSNSTQDVEMKTTEDSREETQNDKVDEPQEESSLEKMQNAEQTCVSNPDQIAKNSLENSSDIVADK